MNPDLLQYIKEELKNGSSPEKIKTILHTAGWQDEEVLSALQEAEKPSSPITTIASTPSAVYADTTSATTAISGRKNKIPKIIGMVVAFFLVGGGGVFGYYYFVAPPRLSPDEVIQKMFDALPSIKTAEYTTDMSMKGKGGTITQDTNKRLLQTAMLLQSGIAAISNPSLPSVPVSGTLYEYGFTGHAEGAMDINDPEHPKYAAKMDFSLEGLSGIIGTKFNAGIEFRMLEDAWYLQATTLPDLGPMGGNLDEFKNKWIKIDLAALEDNLKNYGGLNDDEFEKLSTNRALAPETVEKMIELARTSNLIQITETLPDEELEGESTYHYRVALNIESFKQFIIEGQEIIYGKPLSEREQAAIMDSASSIKSVEGEIWIGKDTFYVKKYAVHTSIESSNQYLVASGDMDITTELKNINESVSIEAPAESVSIEEFFGNLFGDARQAGMDARRLADLRTIQTVLELYYRNKGSYPTGIKSWADLSRKLESVVTTTDIPDDPKASSGAHYCYAVDSAGDSYVLSASLEGEAPTGYSFTRSVPTGGGMKCSCNLNNYCVGF